MGSLAAHLRRRSRADLEALLSARPDLLHAGPVSWDALAELAADDVSVRDALDHLDLFSFQLLDAVVLLGDGISRRRFDEFVGPRATRAQIDAALDRLERLALAWRDGPALRLNEGLRYVMPSPPPGLPAAQRIAAMSGQQLQPVLRTLGLSDKGSVGDRRLRLLGFLRNRGAVVARLDKAPATVPELLIDLVNRGAQTGFYEAVADPAQAEAMNWLRANGMLLPTGPHGFELPCELRDLVLERVQLVRLDPAPPDLRGAPPDPAETARVDNAAVLAIIEVVHGVERVAEAVDAEPPALLKSGGVGVRDLKRLAACIGRTVREASSLLELAAAAGLVETEVRAPELAPRRRQRQRSRSVSAPEPGRVLVTEAFDGWRLSDTAVRWAALVAGWAAHPRPLAMPEQPGQKLLPLQACQLEPEIDLARLKRRMLDALDPADAHAHAGGGSRPATGPAAARRPLATCQPAAEEPQAAALPNPSALASGQPAAEEPLAAALHWGAPLTTPYLPGLVRLLLSEAEVLGLVAFGRLAEPARRLRAACSVADLLPPPVPRVTLQADLTALVAGPPAHDLAALLDRVARRESRGGATTWRFSADSVRAALA